MRIGIDVGGTNTDAVLMDGMHVLAEVKTGTTADVTSGIVSALRGLVEQSGASASDIQAVMIGTTHFTNAVVEAKRLVPTAVVRLGLPATRALPPLVDWPPRLRKAIAAHVYLCHGGHEFDGREISPLDRDELLRVAEDIRGRRHPVHRHLVRVLSGERCSGGRGRSDSRRGAAAACRSVSRTRSAESACSSARTRR